ncbi:lytic murein transglycosylase [Pikeienuella piscinae]|uniref:Lytic murein transglycosylase n=1 Tax=Pikeienuella piscinae TaxID=2748098 RepID=A0A7L5BZC8_9RHOB|nr:lytic murein transglycosylase [Pikeienuella piscinae]QIE56453.1 lytic murein transglycosylase [Pikeienuella piscinae]
MSRVTIIAGLAFALTGCAAPGGAEAPSSAPAPIQAPGRADNAAPNISFTAWRDGFRVRALAQGVSAATFDRAFRGVTPNDKVVELDRYQPEFTRPIWEYLDSAVSPTRIANGQAKLASEANALRAIESQYGVDKEVVLAIWGLESAYGDNYGSIPVIESLATLAYEGRRRDFAEEQLIEALKIIDSGDISPERMVGSWAGAMGHTQFIPTSFQAYAVDFTGDGRRDLWAADPSDALASTANYLSRFGWKLDAPWGVEISLPSGFDYTLADQSLRRPVADWRAMGVTLAGGGAIPDHGEAAILLPAGANGPAFALFSNFDVIRRYNNATSYALAVGHLSDRIAGGGPFRAAWPRDDKPLSRSETEEMQRRLTSLGFDTQGVDGIIGPMSRTAIRDFQRSRNLTPDGYASTALLAALRSAGG